MFFVSLSIPEGPIAHQLSIAKSRQWWCWCWWWRWRWGSLWWLSGSSRSSSQEVTSAQAATTLPCKVHSSQVLIDCMWIIYFVYSIDWLPGTELLKSGSSSHLNQYRWRGIKTASEYRSDEKGEDTQACKPFIISFTLYVETHWLNLLGQPNHLTQIKYEEHCLKSFQSLWSTNTWNISGCLQYFTAVVVLVPDREWPPGGCRGFLSQPVIDCKCMQALKTGSTNLSFYVILKFKL